MTSLADRTIETLRRTHGDTVRVVSALSDDQLASTSGAAEWTVAQTLSHLGSGAEIAHAGVRAALEGADAPGQDFKQSVWDRWNASSARQQADGLVEHDTALIEALEALSPQQRQDTQVAWGFLPEPLPLTSVLGMRLSEAALHSWDVRVALDPTATVDANAAAVLVEHYSGGMGFLLGFTGHPDQLQRRAIVHVPAVALSVVIDDRVTVDAAAEAPTATFTGAPEALVRLMAGRLTPLYTPADVDVTGDVTLEELRRVFPGY